MLLAVRLLRTRRRVAGAIVVVLAALAGARAAFALLWLTPRTVPGQAVATVGDDYYAKLKPRPKLFEPVAGEVGGVVSGTYRLDPEPGVGSNEPARRGRRRRTAQRRRGAPRPRAGAAPEPPGPWPVVREPAGGGPGGAVRARRGLAHERGLGLLRLRRAAGLRRPPGPQPARRGAQVGPCGALITFRYGGRVVRVPVIDRGPYIAGREWDLTGATAELLGFNGLDFIEWSV